MGHKIAVEGIKIYAYHGCLDEEAKIGGNYIVDVYMETDFTRAAHADDLSHTIDYCSVYEIVKTEMAQRAKLIENVADRIHRNISKSFTAVKKTRVRLTKLSPPMNGNVEKVYVEIE
jgi:7,8-dihydroneopterin aldolase/epimerase/oxygenase